MLDTTFVIPVPPELLRAEPDRVAESVPKLDPVQTMRTPEPGEGELHGRRELIQLPAYRSKSWIDSPGPAARPLGHRLRRWPLRDPASAVGFCLRWTKERGQV